VRISATLELADFERDGIDAAVRVGRGRYPGLVSHRLFGESVVPMCSPALLKGEHALASPTDLRHHVLLHFDWPAQEQVTPDWGTWLRSTKVKGVDAIPRAALLAAGLRDAGRHGGAGVVLGWRSLAQADIDSGRLTIPFDLPLEMDVAFYLIYPEASVERPKLARFREWLLGQTTPGIHSRPKQTAKRRKHRA
jgi:LysR family glycine cleavage system transcriptional activator